MDRLEKEAQLFAHYHTRRKASPQAIRLYKVAMGKSKLSGADRKLLNLMVAHPRLIGFIDAGLVFHDSASEARRRLYVMLAIVEASPDHHDLFLPKARNPLYLLVVLYSSVRAIVKAGLGLLLVKAVA